MKRFSLILTTLFILTQTSNGFAKKRDDFHGYFAFGGNLTPADAVCIGYDQWELGKLHPFMYGVSKILPLDSTTYTSLGFGLMGAGFGLKASIGVNYNLFWQIGFRGEIFASANSQGVTFSHGLVGFSWNY
jgi:hypothetical protein